MWYWLLSDTVYSYCNVAACGTGCYLIHCIHIVMLQHVVLVARHVAYLELPRHAVLVRMVTERKTMGAPNVFPPVSYAQQILMVMRCAQTVRISMYWQMEHVQVKTALCFPFISGVMHICHSAHKYTYNDNNNKSFTFHII